MDPSSPNPPAPNPKLSWFIMWAAFTVAPVIYFVVGSQVAGHIPAGPSLPMFRTVMRVLALLAVLMGVVLVRRTPRARADAIGLAALFGGTELAPAPTFQRMFIVTTGMIESCSIYGFVLLFLGAPLAEYLPFGAGTMAVMLGVALPTGLRYWGERESAEAGGPAPVG